MTDRTHPQARPCVVCGKPQAPSLRPFCSRRCADVDLHRWLSGAYAVPALDDDSDDGAPAEGRHRELGAHGREHGG